MMIREHTQSLYERIGGEAQVRRLVQRFYQYMDEQSSVATIRAMHPKDLHTSEEKLFMFLSGWLGGPALYIEAYGHPRLRMRHIKFAIDEEARDQWMACMKVALGDVVASQVLRDELYQSFYEVADFMRNQ